MTASIHHALIHCPLNCPLDMYRCCQSCDAIFSPLLSVCRACGSPDHSLRPICGEAIVEAKTKIAAKGGAAEVICRVKLREGYSLLASAHQDVDIGKEVRLYTQEDGQLLTGDSIR